MKKNNLLHLCLFCGITGFSQINIFVNGYDITGLLTIYPNPTKGKFNIEVTEPNLNLKLHDCFGKEIVVRQLMTGVNEIDLSNYSDGVFTSL